MAGRKSGKRDLSNTDSHYMTTLGGDVIAFVDVGQLGTGGLAGQRHVAIMKHYIRFTKQRTMQHGRCASNLGLLSGIVMGVGRRGEW